MKASMICGAVAVFGAALYWLVPVGSSPARAEGAEVAYLCRETRQVVFAPPQAVPAVHPQTGRPTLDRALYCPQCRSWHPVPPTWPGNPLAYRCPRTRGPLEASGPAK